MTRSILITQCLQRDFVAPLQPHEPLPTSLHVGPHEARRLVGVDPETGPVAQLLHWARAQSETELQILHIRDWHNPADPGQRKHLEHFGLHCIEDTPGAQLVVGEAEVPQRSNERFVNSIALNDFEGGTDLAEHLGFILGSDNVDDVRVGVVGVWTEAKVTFLLYELLTRCRFVNLATCSALTASASRSQHFNALDQLRKILGVSVFDSIGEFAGWLLPEARPVDLPLVSSPVHRQMSIECDVDLDENDKLVLAYLFKHSSKVELQTLGGGYSAARVFRVRSRDAVGHAHAASVLKLGSRATIAQERVAFERVESILGNDAPAVRGFADLGDRAGIAFAYAGMGNRNVQTFDKLYAMGLPSDRVDAVLHEVFRDILGRFYDAAQYEKLPLWEYYTFDKSYAGAVRDKIARLMGPECACGEWLTFPGGYTVPNVADFYESGLLEMSSLTGDFHFVSYVHGDLNAANVLLDERENVWLIDFFQTHRGHVLRDVAKLENDLLYVLTPIRNADDFAEAMRITRALRCVKDLRAALPISVPGLQNPDLLRAWRTLATLRRIGGQICREERDPLHLLIALLRYAVHTLSFEGSSDWQKLWALAAACGYAEDLSHAARQNHDLRVDWLDAEFVRPGHARVGLTICPGRADRGRNLAADLAMLASVKTGRLLCLMEPEEMEWAGVSSLERQALAHDIETKVDAIPDQHPPTISQMDRISNWVTQGLEAGENVVIHCLGGLGRSGTVAACLLVRIGLSSEAAIAVVRQARGPRAVETEPQRQFVDDYARHCTK